MDDETRQSRNKRRLWAIGVPVAVACLLMLVTKPSPPVESPRLKPAPKVTMTYVKSDYTGFESLTKAGWNLSTVSVWEEEKGKPPKLKEHDLGLLINMMLEGESPDRKPAWEDVAAASPYYLVHKVAASGKPGRVLGVLHWANGCVIAGMVAQGGGMVITPIGFGPKGDDYEQLMPTDRLLCSKERNELAASFRKRYEALERDDKKRTPVLGKTDKVVIDWVLHCRAAPMPVSVGGWVRGGEMIMAEIALGDQDVYISAGIRVHEYYRFLPGKDNRYEGGNPFTLSVPEEELIRKAVEGYKENPLRKLFPNQETPAEVPSIRGA